MLTGVYLTVHFPTNIFIKIVQAQWAGKRTLTILVTKQLNQEFYLIVQSLFSSFKNCAYSLIRTSLIRTLTYPDSFSREENTNNFQN